MDVHARAFSLGADKSHGSSTMEHGAKKATGKVQRDRKKPLSQHDQKIGRNCCLGALSQAKGRTPRLGALKEHRH